jgi:hypothetical protein
MNLAQQAWEQNNSGRLRQLLEETQGYPDRGFEWYYWQRQSHLELKTLRGHLDAVTSVAFSPDNQRIVTGSGDNTAKVWEAASGKELLTLVGTATGFLPWPFPRTASGLSLTVLIKRPQSGKRLHPRKWRPGKRKKLPRRVRRVRQIDRKRLAARHFPRANASKLSWSLHCKCKKLFIFGKISSADKSRKTFTTNTKVTKKKCRTSCSSCSSW